MQTSQSPITEVSYEWKRWAAENLMGGLPVDTLVSTMVAEGISEDVASATCAEVLADPVYQAGEWATQRLRKLEAFLDIRQQMRDIPGAERGIDRRSGLSTEQFLRDYYATNQPVILGDVCDQWPACTLWSPEYLLEKLGDVDVEVMASRDSDTRYEINSDEHRQILSFREYVAHVLQNEGNDAYLVANNHLLESESAKALSGDFTMDPRYLDPSVSPDHGTAFLWFGPAGTVTPLHHDLTNLLFNQVLGQKRFVLVSPLDSHCVYNDLGVYSEVDPAAPDYSRFPRFLAAKRFEVTLGPGDSLFIPAGWWHHVVSLSVSISVSLSNFRFPNQLSWFHPNIAR